MDFNHFFKRLVEEWERTLMSILIFSLFIYLAFMAYSMLTENEGSSQNSVKPKAPHRFFDTNDTVYIAPLNLPASINPFVFHIKISLPPPSTPKQPSGKPDVKQTPDKKNPGKKPDAKQPPPKEAPAEAKKVPKTDGKKESDPPKASDKPAPKKPVRKISVQYRGFLKGTTEEQVAFYSALDSQGKKTEAKSAKEGAKIHGLIPIKSFDADKMVVTVGGKDVIVKRGKKQDFNIQ